MLLEDRVLWFRTRAARDRWQEEVTLLETESRRLLQGFSRMATTWTELSSSSEPIRSRGFAVYAARRAHVFETLHASALRLFLTNKVPVEKDANVVSSMTMLPLSAMTDRQDSGEFLIVFLYQAIVNVFPRGDCQHFKPTLIG